MMEKALTYYEFFAGGGMARAGLGKHWQCLLANDFDFKKAASYEKNWGSDAFICADIRNLSPDDMSEQASLAWASFPCQDLSLAGGGAGLKGDRSGTFWPFISHMEELKMLGRAPAIIVLENVMGTLTSHRGEDFKSICGALSKLGYSFGALVIDASLFVPQSRQRLFVVALKKGLHAPDDLVSGAAVNSFHPQKLVNAFERLPDSIAKDWLWWNLPLPSKRKQNFIDILEENPRSVSWHTQKETTRLLSMMSEVNLAKVETAKASGVPMVGGVYKRTRYEHGIKVQRAEVRFDRVAGCLRTPGGGSSRQLILKVNGEEVRSRLISSRETARLMGLKDSYVLPDAYNEAYHLTGDGVAVPVVRFLRRKLFEPLIEENIDVYNQKVANEGRYAVRT